MKSQASVEIDRPIDDVFRLTNEGIVEWSSIIVEEEVLEEKNNGGVGTRLRTVTEERGKQMVFEGVVTKYDPPNVSAVQMTGKHFDIDVEYTFEDLGGRTRVTAVSDVTGKGLTKVFFLLFGWMMYKSGCDAQQKEFDRLKAYCEAQS